MKFLILLCLLSLTCSSLLLAQPQVTAWDILQQGLNDKNPDKRKQAVTAIGTIGLSPETTKLIEQGLRDDDSGVRQVGAGVLGQIKSTSSIPALKAAFDDPSGEVAFTAAKALWDMGDRSGETILQDVMTGQQKSTGGMVDGAVRDVKSKMHDKKYLARMGIKEAGSALLGPFSIGITAAEELMKDGGAPGRIVSATLLSQNCSDRNLQLIEFAFKEDKNNTVRAALARALGQCGTKDDIPRLEAYLSSGNDTLKFMSAAAIVRLTAAPR
jgi:HEAT repeat protein